MYKIKKSKKIVTKNMPRVRIELTTLRLWDLRAAYCATEALESFSKKTYLLKIMTRFIDFLIFSIILRMQNSIESPGITIWICKHQKTVFFSFFRFFNCRYLLYRLLLLVRCCQMNVNSTSTAICNQNQLQFRVVSVVSYSY